MPKTIITPDQDAVVSETEVAAPPERVFQALITAEQAMQWGNGPAFQITLWQMDPRVGGRWRFISKEKQASADTAKAFAHHGEVLEIDPPKLLVYTWFADWHEDPEHKTVVRWDITPIATGTKLKVTHSGLSQMPAACKGYSQGWPGLLEQIRLYAEK
jgi:uncharacterized protein YndB with AHSA1/START domain